MIATLFKENEDLQKENKKLKNKVYTLKERPKKIHFQRIL